MLIHSHVIEFKAAVKEMDLRLSEDQCKSLFLHFDHDQSGAIDIEEFIAGIRGPIRDDVRVKPFHRILKILSSHKIYFSPFQRVLENKISCTYDPMRLAPGIRTSIDLELTAEVPGVTQCELRLMEASTQT